jgi:hypothetical protein
MWGGTGEVEANSLERAASFGSTGDEIEWQTKSPEFGQFL